ncbi:MAG: methenyltetrahydromethanopterin cyclohydrolase [Caldilineaceae bacterium]|nr:methenyltetrahydromethanopterin cyclohydrolase [Caldilineaceae bacterium]
MLSINRDAMKIVRRILDAPEALGVAVSRLLGGATVIDMGQRAPGSWAAGKLYTLVTLGGLAEVSYEPFAVGDRALSAVRVMIDHPLEACIASQIAGWRLEGAREGAPILAGPARSLNHANPDHYFELTDYRDEAGEGVIAIQTAEPVTEDWATTIAQACKLQPENLYILVAPNSSLVCAIQVAARIVEQSLHRLAEEGFDVATVKYAHGFGVIPPLIADEVIAMGRINDSLLYGGVATLYVDADDAAIAAVIGKVVSVASRAYGRPFVEIYEDAGRDFYQIPLDLHSPAVLHINNIRTGRTFSAGEINYAVLQQSFFGVEKIERG